jgi:signal peptidase I
MSAPDPQPAHRARPGDDIEGPPASTDGDHGLSQPGKRTTSPLREVIETALLAVLIFVLVRSFVLNFKVDGSSMLPTFENGEMLLVNRNAYRAFDAWDIVDWIPGVDERNTTPLLDLGGPDRGDVIVFTPPAPGHDKPYIKRVIGVAGDHIQITEDAVVVNGTRLEEDYVNNGNRCDANWPYCGEETIIVPIETVFVMGDNRSDSQDSRYFGTVPVENIIGKAWVVYWPIDVWGTVSAGSYPELSSP